MARDPHPSFLHSLRTRFIAIVGLTVALCLGASTLITLKLHYQQLIETKREKAEVLKEGIAQLLARTSQSPAHTEIQHILKNMGRQSDIRTVRLIGSNDLILKSSQPDEIGLRFIMELPPTAVSEESTIYSVVDEGIIQRGQRLESGQIDRKIMAIVQRPRNEGWAFLPQVLTGRSHRHPRTFSATASIYDEVRCGQCHQEPVAAHINIGLSLEEMNWSLQIVGTRLLIWALVTTVLIGVVISILFSRQVNAPLSELIRTMRSVEKGDFQTRTTLQRKDEIGFLGDKFNSMVEQLEIAQEEIQRYHDEQMERASRMASVGEMASALAHEIRNPLAGISGAGQILRRDLKPDEPRYEVLTEIIEQVDRLARAVSNIIRYARFQPLQLERVSLNTVLAEALEAFESQLEESNVTAIVEEEPELPQVRVDPSQMQQVFMNLILNARKSMPGGGELNIRIHSGVKNDKEVQVVEFEDTSPGLPPEHLEEIFKPFYTKKSGDTGLGLSVAEKIVTLHGGTIAARSEMGKGTVFVITLPVDGPSQAADASYPSTPIPQGLDNA
jgi:signal transduction histidine kinase